MLIPAFILGGCYKHNDYRLNATPPRKVKFVLYTDQDFAGEENNITFSLLIKTKTHHLLDSALSTIKIKDIPHIENKWEFEKQVMNDDGSQLDVGFVYSIENVGYSWHLDSLKPGEAYKEVTYIFR